MSNLDIRVPDIGDIDSVEVIEILVSVGDHIAIDESVVTVESDKASMEIPASASGTITSLAVDIGATVKQGDLIAVVDAGSGTDAKSDASDENNEHSDGQSTNDSTIARAAQSAIPEPQVQSMASTTDAAAAGSTATVQTVVVPDIGDSGQVEVIEILVSKGDEVELEQSLVTLESDKASMEVPATVAGTVEEILINIGDQVAEGSKLVTVLGGGNASATEATPASAQAQTQPESGSTTPGNEDASTRAPAEPSASAPSPGTRAPSPTAHINTDGGGTVHASPGVRRYAREHGADLKLITGTGRKSRILKEDVIGFIKQSMEAASSNYRGSGVVGGGSGIPAVPDIDFSKFGDIERVPLGRINKISARNLHRAWLNVPHVTHHDEADITEMEAFRKALKNEARDGDPRITGLAFHMKALAQTLKAFPKFNTSLTSDGESLIQKHYYHIGIAVDTPHGLVVPVFRDVDRKTISELTIEMQDISQRARDKKLKPDEMQGASMTISNLGGIGGTAFTPIVNTPEVAILGLARARMQPVWNGSDFTPRLMCPIDLSYDHRVIDGADAARFVAHYCKSISDVRRLLI